MTLADMILAHDSIGRLVMDIAVELHDVIDGDALLRPELMSLVERVAMILDHEFGADTNATVQVRAALERGASGIQF